MTPAINKKLHAQLSQKNLMDMKAVLILGATNGRTDSAKEMTDSEAISLISKLNAGSAVNPEAATCERLRKQLIAMSYSIEEQPSFVKEWAEKMGVFDEKKKFNEYNSRDLRGLISKFKKVVNHRLEAIKKL